VLTARHCLTEPDDSQSPASVLTFRIGSVHPNSGGSLAQAKRVVRHDDSADIGLVELTAPVTDKPISIAASAPVGSPLRLIGFGCTVDPTNGCNLPDTLQQIDTSILPDKTLPDGTTCGGENLLCVSNPDGSRGACNGDSGGPAVIKAGGEWTLAGATSGGTSDLCGQGPSEYVDVPHLRPWIESNIGSPPAGGTNLALNRPVKSKQASCNATEIPAKAVDGSVSKTTDKWCSAVAGAKSLEVDLGAGKALKKLVVKHAGAGGEAASLNTRSFVLETSIGGGSWTTAATVTANTSAATTTTVSVTARWIRITTTDAIARIYEFEAYA
jgi:hypothetical protein